MAVLLDFDSKASTVEETARESLGNPWNDVQRGLDAVGESAFLWFMWLCGGQQDVGCARGVMDVHFG